MSGEGKAASDWVRPVVLAVSCLILGFVGGWVLHDLGGGGTSLPDAKVDVSVEESAPRTTTVAPPAAPKVERAQVSLAVLNGTGRAGLAAETAARATAAGYSKVTTGNAGSQLGGTVVYFRDSSRPAAQLVAKDLGFETVRALTDGPLARAAGEAQVVVVLAEA